MVEIAADARGRIARMQEEKCNIHVIKNLDTRY
jgi:hypothetical protein